MCALPRMPGDSCEGELAEICTQGVCTEGLCPDAAKDEACASPFLYDDISNDHPPCELGLTCDQSLAQSIVGTAGKCVEGIKVADACVII